MNETKFDHLLRVTAPRSDWGTPPPRHREDRSGFDDHLAHASTSQSLDKFVGPPTESRATESSPVSDPPPAESARPSEDEVSTASAPGQEATGNAEINPAGSQTSTADGRLPKSDSAPAEDETEVHEDDDPVTSKQLVQADDVKLAKAAVAVGGSSEVSIATGEWNNNSDHAATLDAMEKAESLPTGKIGGQRPVTRREVHQSQLTELTSDVLTDDVTADVKTIPAPAASVEASPPAEERPATAAVPSLDPSVKQALRVASRSGEPAPFHKNALSDQFEPDLSTAEQSTVDDSIPENVQPDGAAGELQDSSDKRREAPAPRHTGVWQKVAAEIAAVVVQAEAVAATNAAKIEAPEEMTNEVTKTEAIDPPNRSSTPPGSTRSDTLLNPLTKLQQVSSNGHRSNPPAEGDNLPRVDAARFIGRVARAFHTAQERGGTLQLRLSPPELGTVRLELVVKDGVLAAMLETETPAARRVLLDHLPALRDRLTEQNIRIERFDVDVRRDGSGGQHPSTAQQQQREQQSPFWTPPRNQAAPSDRAEESTARSITVVGATDSQINFVA